MTIARSLKYSNQSLKILVLEKENEFGLHASGRNSGVLHAGFYYSPESLKAQFCREGNFEMKKLAEKHNLQVHNVGKVVVAKNDDELSRMHNLYERGIANKVDLHLLDESKLKEYEPLAKTYKNFLWSPTTAIVDKQEIMQALYSELVTANVSMLFNQKFVRAAENVLFTQQLRIEYKHLINAAGSGALSIAKSMDFGSNHMMIPFLGVYRATQLRNLPLNNTCISSTSPPKPFSGYALYDYI